MFSLIKFTWQVNTTTSLPIIQTIINCRCVSWMPLLGAHLITNTQCKEVQRDMWRPRWSSQNSWHGCHSNMECCPGNPHSWRCACNWSRLRSHIRQSLVAATNLQRGIRTHSGYCLVVLPECEEAILTNSQVLFQGVVTFNETNRWHVTGLGEVEGAGPVGPAWPPGGTFVGFHFLCERHQNRLSMYLLWSWI